MDSKQGIFSFERNSHFDIGGFFEDVSNEEALKWLMAWPNWPNNRLNIYGNYACGKSHLGKLWRNYANAYHVTSASLSIREILNEYNSFLIDPLEDLLKYESWLFDFINICNEENASILMLSSTTDFHNYTSLNDLISRLNATSHVRILQPNDELLKKIIQKIGSDLGIFIKPHVVEYIINHTNRSIENITALLDQVNKISLIAKKPIEIKMIKDAL